MKLTENTALDLLNEWVKSESLKNHCLAVGHVMRHIARENGEDEERFAISGILHDADWECAPRTHPKKIVEWVREHDEPEIADAIAAHGTEWRRPYNTLMDKALVASDELTGLVGACCKIRPDGIEGLKVKSVLKRFRNGGFASGVDRSEIRRGLEIYGVTLEDHIQTIIDALRPVAAEIGLAGTAAAC